MREIDEHINELNKKFEDAENIASNLAFSTSIMPTENPEFEKILTDRVTEIVTGNPYATEIDIQITITDLGGGKAILQHRVADELC